MGLLKFKRYKAKMFNDKGEHIKDKWFSNFAKTFEFKNKAFNIKHKDATFFDTKGFFYDTRYYLYNIDNPDPFKLEKKVKPVMDSETYNLMLKTNIAKKLNDISKSGFLDFLKEPKNLIMAVVSLILFYLVSTGQLNSIISG